MEIKTQNTKQLRGAYAQYLRSNLTKLRDYYGRYSYEKERIFEKEIDEMIDRGGESMRILSHNCSTFTLGYMLTEEIFCYITKDSTRYFDIKNYR